MSYYVMKLYGLVCDVCEFSEDYVPEVDEPRKLAATRADFAERGWKRVGARDICPNLDAEHEAARSSRD
ncbi:hypothetical protein [Micromonospora sp. C41]|uniref:hypothetical protein n=1 Tax=Micromonospora sp. C41 TaxID=2824878 RepID=UPI001B377A2B|nr:hypothetical protein [Micromonospora sp. C41]MBQ1064495.1 hypothetical protein [Micromonospora sp. C41]